MAAARPKGRGNKDLPRYLSPKGAGFLYNHPKATKTKYFQRKDSAIDYAIAANRAFENLATKESTLALQYPNSIKVNKLLSMFKSKYLPRLNHAEKTLKREHSLLTRFNNDLGEYILGQIDQVQLSQYLDNGFSGDGYIKARALFIHIYKYALSKGYSDVNLAQNTLTGVSKPKVTQPHNDTELRKVISVSPDWLQDMIIFAKATLLRPDDIRNLKKEDVDMAKRTVRVAVRKTKNYKEAIYLELFLEHLPGAFEAIQRRMASPIISPYVFCYRPHERAKQAQIEAKKHWSFITKTKLSTAFKKARDISKAYVDLSVAERPTFKELRNFGAQQYKEQNYPEKFIQMLMGHKDFATTQIYLDDGKPEYQEVKL